MLDAGWGTIPNERAAEAGRRAIALSTEIGDDRGAGAAHALMILIELQLGDEGAAEAEAQAALDLLEPLGESAELAEALHRIGWLHWRRGEDATAVLRRAVEMARRVGAPEVLAGATHTLAVQLCQKGATADGLAMMEDAFVLAKQVDDQVNLLRIYTNFASTLTTDASDLPRALEIATEGLEVSRRAGATGFVGWQLENIGAIQAEMGELSVAEVTLQEALAAASEVGDGPLMGFIHQDLGRWLLEQGRIDEGEAQLAASDAILRERTEAQGVARGERMHAMIASARGDEDAAILHLHRGVEPAFAGSGVNADQWLFLDLFIALSRSSAREEAAEIWERLDARGTSPAIRAVVSVGRGLLEPDASVAVDDLRGAADTLEGLGIRVQQARVRIELARVERLAGMDPAPSLERARSTPGGVRRPPVPARGRRARLGRLMADAVGEFTERERTRAAAFARRRYRRFVWRQALYAAAFVGVYVSGLSRSMSTSGSGTGSVWNIATVSLAIGWALTIPVAFAGARDERAQGLSQGWRQLPVRSLVWGLLLILAGPAWMQQIWDVVLFGYGQMVGTLVWLPVAVLLAPLLVAVSAHKVDDPPTAARLRSLIRRSRVQLDGVRVRQVMRGTRRQNAFVVGVWPTRRLVVFDTLAAEGPICLDAAVAHELGHMRLHHTVKRLGVFFAVASVVFVATVTLVDRLPGALLYDGVPVGPSAGSSHGCPSSLRIRPTCRSYCCCGGPSGSPCDRSSSGPSARRSAPRICSASGSRGTRWGSRCSCDGLPSQTSPTLSRAGSRGCCSRPTGASPTGSPGCAPSRCRPWKNPDRLRRPARPSPTSGTQAGSRTRCRARSCVPPT